MRTAGIICEFNPFHAGHRLLLQETRRLLGEDAALVCLMSGNFVQRGEPALYARELRAEAAIRSGADLVLELPLTIAVNAAGWFASGGVRCLHDLGCIDYLAFGSESGALEPLQHTAELLCSPAFDAALRAALETGCSYAAARTAALKTLGGEPELLQHPNNALGADYLTALLQLDSSMQPLTIPRDLSLPSASQLRGEPDGPLAEANIPCGELYAGAVRHTLQAGERAMLAVLRTRSEAEFQAMPFGSEGLWSMVMKACRREPGVEEILLACKSKRYTLSRLRRMLLCLCLGLSAEDLQREIPYLHVLAFNDRGRSVLRQARETSRLPLISGAVPRTPEAQAYLALETRASDLYSLFSQGDFYAPAGQERARVPIAVR